MRKMNRDQKKIAAIFTAACVMGGIGAAKLADYVNEVNGYNGETLVIEAPAIKPRAHKTIVTTAAKEESSITPEVEALAKTVWGEARGLSETEQAAVVWCVLNRVNSPEFPDDIISVITQKNQFIGYNELNPIDDDIVELVEDVLWRYGLELEYGINSGRVLPTNYLYFTGDQEHNYFRTEYEGGLSWFWTLPSPYEM